MTDNINTYIESQMHDQIVRRSNSPLPSLLLVAVGVAALVPALSGHGSDTLRTTLLTVGFLAGATGLVWLVLCLSRQLQHWHYLPTGSPMREHRLYLSSEDYTRCVECLADGHPEGLAALQPVAGSNAVLHAVVSRDGAVALLQAGRLDTSHFEPSTPVVVLAVEALAPLRALLP